MRPSSSGEEVIEGKTGSGSLVDSSVSDGWSYRSSWGAKRSLPSGRSISQANYSELSSFQPRSVSNAGLPTSYSSTAQNSATLGSRPPTVNLNATSNQQTRSGLTAPYPFGFSGRGGEQPPTVYTKFDRPGEPGSRKLPDSAKDGSWSQYSPADERKPFNISFGNRTSSTPASRDGSLPSSNHNDESPFFADPNYSRTSQQPTQNNSRAPSISSQTNGVYNYADASADQLNWQLNQLSLSTNNRPPTSHKGSIGSNAMFSQPSPLSTISPFTRTPMAGPGLEDDPDEVDSSGMNYYKQHHFIPSHQLNAYSGFSHNMLDSREIQTNSATEVSLRQPFANGTLPSQALGMYSSARMNPTWASIQDSSTPPNRRLADAQEQAQLDLRMQQQLFGLQARTGYHPVYNPFALPPTLQTNGVDPFVPFSSMAMSPVPGIGNASDPNSHSEDTAQSFLMYDFKANQKTRRYELKDIFDHISEFSGDQYGSRFIQTKLESANSDDKERVFKEIEPNAIQLMTDVFGNYVIQKLFEHGDQRHKKILANKMKGEVLQLSLQMYGCRVVQKALDHVLVDQQQELISELEGHVLKCVKDQNGNHVIQKAIERCPSSSIAFIIQAFRGDVQILSVHPYGCRVIQRCLERCEPASKAMIMEELMACIETLVTDQYGNYVVQHVVQHDEGHGKSLVLDIVGRGLEAYSKHKFASNVVEKCLEKSGDDWKRKVMYTLANGHPQRAEGEGVFVSMIKDSYGNYVIRKYSDGMQNEQKLTGGAEKLLDTLTPDDYLQLVDMLQPALSQAKRTGCGKQVLSIEKKMHRVPGFRGGPTNVGAYNAHAFRPPVPQFGNAIDSATTTPPPLTADTRSIQSSAMQSIDGDTVEGAAAIYGRKGSNHSSAGFYQ